MSDCVVCLVLNVAGWTLEEGKCFPSSANDADYPSVALGKRPQASVLRSYKSISGIELAHLTQKANAHFTTWVFSASRNLL